MLILCFCETIYAMLQMWHHVKTVSLILQYNKEDKEAIVITSQSGAAHNNHSQACTVGLFGSEPVKHATLGDFTVGTVRHVLSSNVAMSQCSIYIFFLI